MTVRKLQKTGGASLSVIIPKKWAANLKLTDKSELVVDSSQEKVLKLYPAKHFFKPKKISINAKDLTIAKLTREIIAAYLAGSDQVIIENFSLKSNQQIKLHQLCSSLIGFEIIEESATQLVLQNIFDIAKFPLSTNLEKMFIMVNAMFEDTLIAIGVQDQKLAQSIIQREKEIDKFHLAITRQFYVHLKNEISQNQNVSTIDLYYFGLVSRQLERIADHCVKICLTIDDQNNIADFSKITCQKLIKLASQIGQEIVRANLMAKNLDRNDAHTILDNCQIIMKKVRRFQMDKKNNFPYLLIACDSFDRICGYLTNMAEATLDQSLV